MKNTALITGASSGIGKDLAIIHASKGNDLVLVARRKDKLVELQQKLVEEYSISCKVISKDLTEVDAVKKLYEEITQENIVIDYLINNAGYGGLGAFGERPLKDDLNMIDLNIRVLTELTGLFLPEMKKRNAGKILNVSSTAAFFPGPFQAVYFASKAFVNSFSLAIAEECTGTNVTVTSLCPGATETEFAKTANLEGSNLFKKSDSSQKVAMKGYQGMMKGKLEVITNASLLFQIKAITPFAPYKLVLKIARSLAQKS